MDIFREVLAIRPASPLIPGRVAEPERDLPAGLAAPPAVGLSFFLGIFTGSWGLTQWLSNSIQSHIDTQALAVKIEEQRRAIKHQQRTTWGVELVERQIGRLVGLAEALQQQFSGLTRQVEPLAVDSRETAAALSGS